MNEKIEFSNRLRDAMARAGYAVSPSVLEHEFNVRWYGRSISTQAAWSWLNSRSIPTQDKIQVLAEWLKIEPEVLRFGDAVRTKVQEHQQRWGEGVGYVERETLDAFLQLPAPERKIIREVILAFIKAREKSATI
jgi:transcriptional regulator with XRE-family HTH domain